MQAKLAIELERHAVERQQAEVSGIMSTAEFASLDLSDPTRQVRSLPHASPLPFGVFLSA